MQERDIVMCRASGVIGVIVPTDELLSHPWPLTVVPLHSKRPAFAMRCAEDYEIVGRYEAAANEKACGLGQGPRECCFLGVEDRPEETRLVCWRFLAKLHWGLPISYPNRRHPEGVFPTCQLPQSEEGK